MQQVPKSQWACLNTLNPLTLCPLGNFSCFFVVCWFFSKSTFLKNSFGNTIRVSNSLDPDQAPHFVGPGLGPNCLQSLSADDTRRQRVKYVQKFIWKCHLFKVICCILLITLFDLCKYRPKQCGPRSDWSSLIRVCTVWPRGFWKISASDKSRWLLLWLALEGLNRDTD